MPEDKKVVSIVESYNLKNNILFMNRNELENKLKDVDSFILFAKSQNLATQENWNNEDELVEFISEVEEYDENSINSYNDIKELILKAFDENGMFVLDEWDEGAAAFFKFQSFE